MKTITVFMTLLFSLVGVACGVDQDLRATWDSYTDTLATSLQLYHSDVPSESGAVLIDGTIPPDSTAWAFTVTSIPGDTTWFGIRAMNGRVAPTDSNRYSDVYEWVPWVAYLTTTNPPSMPMGLTIGVQ